MVIIIRRFADVPTRRALANIWHSSSQSVPLFAPHGGASVAQNSHLCTLIDRTTDRITDRVTDRVTDPKCSLSVSFFSSN